MGKEKIEDKLYQIINQINERDLKSHLKSHSILPNKMHQFCKGNGRISQMYFANIDEIITNNNIK